MQVHVCVRGHVSAAMNERRDVLQVRLCVFKCACVAREDEVSKLFQAH